MTDEKTRADRSDAFKEMFQRTERIRLCKAGSEEFRSEKWAKKYLPPEAGEETSRQVEGGRFQRYSEWEQRRNLAEIEPFFTSAVEDAVGEILRRGVAFGKDVPDDIQRWMERADQQRNHLAVFARRWLSDAVEFGLSCCMVDAPRFEGTRAADERAWRPYLVHIRFEDLRHAEPMVVGAEVRLRLLRYVEKTEKDGKRTIHHVRELEQTDAGPTSALWHVIEEKEGKAKEEVLAEPPVLLDHHEYIPVEPLYTGWEGFFRARPPWLDLADMNIGQTQRQCDLDHSLRITAGAQLHRTGILEEEATSQDRVGPRTIWWSQNPEASAEWLERNGAGAKVLMDRLDRRAQMMERMKGQVFIQESGNETATGRFIDASQASTRAQRWAVGLQDAVENVFAMLSRHLTPPQDDGGSVTVALPEPRSPRDVELLKVGLEANAMLGVPTSRTWLEQYKRQGGLPDDFDVDKEVGMVEEVLPGVASGPSYVVADTEGGDG